MGRNEEFAARVTALEHRVAKAQQDASAARVLAGAADRDCAEFRRTQQAHTKVLNALRETQIEQGRRLGAVETRLGAVETRLGSVETRLGSVEAKVDSGFTKVNIGMDHLATLLQRVIDKN